jgi:hypothetical protein
MDDQGYPKQVGKIGRQWITSVTAMSMTGDRG